jgi:hypothetical protein
VDLGSRKVINSSVNGVILKLSTFAVVFYSSPDLKHTGPTLLVCVGIPRCCSLLDVIMTENPCRSTILYIWKRLHDIGPWSAASGITIKEKRNKKKIKSNDGEFTIFNWSISFH